ncbi:MAG: acyltransferase family protein [Pseudomonadota bacterium]
MTIRNSNFRDDINGLRAWAVVAVILYHFGITGFSGGFVGVDVFFVISGFLMSGIIVSELEKTTRNLGAAQFSLINFYLSRARRIVPALLTLCVVLIVAGWFFLSNQEYKALGSHVISAIGFFSNIRFWREDGYFDAASHEKLLLHTWSLSVEWQFYLILPLLLLAVWKLWPGRKPLIIAVVLGLLLSLLLSIMMTPRAPAAAFYLLPTRAWEMLAGGLVYLVAGVLRLSDRTRIALECTGFALVIASILLFDSSSSWPGWRALVPVIGTMLIITAARQGSLFTGSRIAQWLGDCSYSLYLWHWPFVVALVYLNRAHDPQLIAIGLVLTLVLGRLSYQLIETSARTSLSRLSPWKGASTLLAGVLVLVAGTLILKDQLKQGIQDRIPAQIEAVFNEVKNKNPRRKECHVSGEVPVPECTYGGDQLGVIVMGDSHAASVIRSIEKALPDKNLQVLDWTMSGCATIVGMKKVKDSSYRCGEFVTEALSKQKQFASTVPLVIVNRMGVYLMGPNEVGRADEVAIPAFYLTSPYETRSPELLQEMRKGIIDTACEFAKYRPVYMVRPIPELKVNVPNVMGRALMLGHPVRVSISMAEYQARHAFAWETQDMAAERCGVKILDPMPSLCSEGRCWGNTDQDGLPIYLDSNHLSERGGALLIPMFRQVFETRKADLGK